LDGFKPKLANLSYHLIILWLTLDSQEKKHLFSPTVTHGFTQILGSTVSKRGTTGHEIPHETPSGMSFREHRRLVWYAILNNLPKQL